MEEIEAPIRQMRFVYPYGELEGTMGHYSVYPYSASHSIEGDVLTYNLPSEYNVTVGTDGEQINTNAAMWAEIIDGHASFKHLGGFFKIYVQNLPSGGGTLTVNTNTKKLTGDFECDLTAETPIIETADYDPSYVPSTDESELPAGAPDGNVVTINFNVDPDASVTEGIFYIPAPLGTYEFVDVTVTPWNDETAGNAPATTVRAFTNVTIKRCTPAAGTIVVTSAQSQLQEYLDNYERVNLVHNITLTSPLVISKEVTLDLNGKRIKAGRFELKESGSYAYGDTHSIAFVVVNGGNLTIIDSSEDNTVYFETATGSVRAQGAPNSHVAYIENGGVLNIKAGNFYNDNDPADGDGSYLINNEGTLNISGGKFVPCYDYVNNISTDTFSEQNYLAYDKATVTNTNITGGEFFGFKPDNSIGITEKIETLDSAFGEDYDVEYEFEESPYVTTYMVTSNKAETFENALNYFSRVPLTEALEVSPTIEDTYVTLNLRNNTLTGTINNTATLTIVDGSIDTETGNSIVNSGTVTLENVKINHESPESEPRTTAAIVNKNGTLTINDKDDEYFANNEITKPVGYGTVITSDYYLCIKSIGEAPAAIATRGVTIPETLPKGEVPTYAFVKIYSGKYVATNSSAVKVNATDLKIENAAFKSKNHSIIVTNSIVNYTDTEFSQTGGTDQMDIYTNSNGKSIINASVASGNDPYVISETNLQLLLDNGGNITLPNDITLTKSLELKSGKNVILDLGGYTLNVDNYSIILKKGSLTVRNGYVVATGVNDAFSFEGAEKTDATTLTIEDNVTITSADGCCIAVTSKNNSENITINTSGNLYTTATKENSGLIYVNGNKTGVKINVTGGKLVYDYDTPIYAAGNVDIKISGDTEITGVTAVEIRAGKLNISGGKFTATGDPFTASANGNGSTSVGAAVAVCQHSTDLPLSATITGGEFIGARAFYQEDLQNETAYDKITLNIAGGKFDGEIYSKVYSKTEGATTTTYCDKFISGGKFNSLSALAYVTNGATIDLFEDVNSVQSDITVKSNVLVNLNGHNVTGSSKTVTVDGNLTINGKGETANSTISNLTIELNKDSSLKLDNVNYDTVNIINNGGLLIKDVTTLEELAKVAELATGDVKIVLAKDITFGNEKESCDAVKFANATSVTIDGNNNKITFKGKAPYNDNPIENVAGIILPEGPITVKNVTLVNEKLSVNGTKTAANRGAVYTTIRGTSVAYEGVIFDGGVQVKSNETFTNCRFTENVLTKNDEGYATDGRFCMFIDHEYDATGEWVVKLENCIFNASGYGCVKVAGDKGAKITVDVKGCTFTNTCPSNNWSKDVPKYDVKATGDNIIVNDLGGNTWAKGLAK